MKEEYILNRMIEASKEDRMRFFAVADTLPLQPKYQDRLVEIEIEKQKWRDMTEIENYPCIKFPLDLPEWMPKIKFASCWNEDYVENILEEYKDKHGSE